ncbi:hypothetical protein DH2020_027265 [Rehmannia glutinosa]|uniref:Uncharacterized protein n=1 Tax=Rehmannia glutinosa TaxID=99300 RepID=A0ABR0VUN7_REHGL
MSDLYGSNESEDMSSFLQILLQNSTSSAATTDSTPASAAAGGLFSGGGAVVESSTSLNFSDPSCFFARESDVMNPSSKNLASSCEMLTMRNGLSLHPGYSLGSLQSTLAPSTGLDLDEGNLLPNANRGTDTLSRDQNVFMQSVLEPTNHGSSTLPMLMPSSANATTSGILPSFVPSMENRYGLFNHLASTKDICRDDTLSRLQLDISCSGNNSSPGISS